MYVTLLLLTVAGARPAPVPSETHRISLVPSSTTAAYLTPLALRVSYRNDHADAWRLDQPDQAAHVVIRGVCASVGVDDVSVRMGTTPLTAFSGPMWCGSSVPPTMLILPGESYSFDVDLTARLRARLLPGRWRFVLHDHYAHVLAWRNRIEGASYPIDVAVVVTRASVDASLAAAGDDALPLPERARHCRLLHWMQPDLPAVDFKEGSGNRRVREQALSDSLAVIERFAEWWGEHRDTSEVDSLLERINEEAGVLDEYKALLAAS